MHLFTNSERFLLYDYDYSSDFFSLLPFLCLFVSQNVLRRFHPVSIVLVLASAVVNRTKQCYLNNDLSGFYNYFYTVSLSLIFLFTRTKAFIAIWDCVVPLEVLILLLWLISRNNLFKMITLSKLTVVN